MSKNFRNTSSASKNINFNNINTLKELIDALPPSTSHDVVRIFDFTCNSEISLRVLARACLEISLERGKNNPQIKSDVLDLLKHCAGEVLEAGNARDLYINARKNNKSPQECLKAFNDYAEEIADVIICALLIAILDGVDIEPALLEKINKNFLRAKKIGDKY